MKHIIRNIAKFCPLLLELQKNIYYDSLIQKSTNKVKTIWDIVKSLTNNKTIINKTNKRDFNNTQKTANAFNQYFSTVTGKPIKKLLKGKL